MAAAHITVRQHDSHRDIHRQGRHSGGLTAQIHLLPWARAYRQATSNANIGIYSIARIPQRERRFHWLGPIIPYHWSVFRLQSRTDIQLSKREDLRHWRVGVVLGDVAHQFLLAKGFRDYPEGNLNTAATAEVVLNQLRVGRVDLMLMSEMSCQISADVCSQFVRALPLPEMGNGLYLAFRSDSSPQLMRQLDEALQSMALDGTLPQLQQLPDNAP